jgi:hypothetical protein
MFFFADIWWRIYITCWTTTLYSWWINIIFTQGNTYCHYWQLTSLQGNLIEIRLLKKFSALYAQAGDAMYSTENVFRILIWTRLLCNVVPQRNEWEFHKCRPWLTWQRIPCTNTGLVTIFFNPSTTLKWFLAHLTQRVMWAIAITWRPLYVVNFFKNLLLWKC